MEKIAKDEGVKVTKEGMDAITYVARGDMRKAINALQAASLMEEQVTEETIYQITATARPEQIKELIEAAISGKFTAARSLLDELLLVQGLSGEDVIIQIHRQMLSLMDSDDLSATTVVRLMDRIGEIDFRMTEGANERIQLEALLAYFALAGSEGK
jgi:replication factor C small subunit